MYTKSTCTMGFSIRHTWIGDVYIDSISIIYICIKSINTKKTYIRTACMKSACIRNIFTGSAGAYIMA